MAGCLCGGYGYTDSKIKKVVKGELTECSLKWTESSLKWAERFLKRSVNVPSSGLNVPFGVCLSDGTIGWLGVCAVMCVRDGL